MLDSMTPDTAVFYEKGTVEGLEQAILEFEGRTFSPQKLQARAQEFSEDNFLRNLERILRVYVLKDQS